MSRARDKGDAYENMAVDHLLDAGLTLVEKNFSCKSGEIDIICRDGDAVVFVEVRSRARSHFGSALESIDTRKQGKLFRAAQVYLQRRGWLDRYPCRFDVMAFDTGTPNQPHRVQWLRNAFQM